MSRLKLAGLSRPRRGMELVAGVFATLLLGAVLSWSRVDNARAVLGVRGNAVVENSDSSNKLAQSNHSNSASHKGETAVPAQTPVQTSAVFFPIVMNRALPPVSRSIDIVAFQSRRSGAWFSTDLSALPISPITPEVTFDITESVENNRRNGRISSPLLSGYVFIQAGIPPSLLQEHIHTIRALFIRSAFMSFVDYPNNRVFTGTFVGGNFSNVYSVNIPTDVRAMIRICNEHHVPVFLGINYSNYIPGPLGTGLEAITPADNIANTIDYIAALEDEGLHLDGVTFGEQIEDENTYGQYKPTLQNSDIFAIYASYARALKARFPDLKVYAFYSDIHASCGWVPAKWDWLRRVREYEVQEGRTLLDGFIFTESYVYVDSSGRLLDSQSILDDTESLYRDTPVYRFRSDGVDCPISNSAYLPQTMDNINTIFGRVIDIGLTEYLPAIPTTMGESDTSVYADMDFIIHYSDVVGIYAQLGLDYVATMLFSGSTNDAKCYVDIRGNRGVNYPVQEQLSQYFSGEILHVDRSVDYDDLKVKVYAARRGERYFIMILNKDVSRETAVRVTLPGHFDLTARLPRRSYTALGLGDNGLTISGIGN